MLPAAPVTATRMGSFFICLVNLEKVESFIFSGMLSVIFYT